VLLSQIADTDVWFLPKNNRGCGVFRLVCQAWENP